MSDNPVFEIGLEKELFILRKGKIIEPAIWNFPRDEMGFLTEIRSIASDNIYPIETSLSFNELSYRLRAEKFGMYLSDTPFLNTDEEFVNHIEDTYHISKFPDLTQNIYKTQLKDNINGKLEKFSHHTGILQEKDVDGCYRLTAGIHVHFSSRDKNTGKVIDLPIRGIVEKMDNTFKSEISDSGRIKGEFEMKDNHGFEYRSLPSNSNIHKVIKESFKILRYI